MYYEELNFEVVSIILWILLHGLKQFRFSIFPHHQTKKIVPKSIKDNFLEGVLGELLVGLLDLYSSSKQMGTLHHVASGSSANEKIYYTTILSQL
jgi:hypothetical protein